MWIKVCGITSAEAADAAQAAGADAIGCVFAPSVRQVSPAVAARLVESVRGRLQIVAVTLHPSRELWLEIAQQFRPDLLQTDYEDYDALPQPLGCKSLPVFRSSATCPDKVPARLLFESARSGSGNVADWSQARRWAERTELVLAGGLHAGNVAAAIAAVRPYGVDASSGVEAAPGVKSPERIFSYVRAARAAFEELSQ